MATVRFSGGAGIIAQTLGTVASGATALVTLPQDAIGAVVQLYDSSGNLLDPNSGIAIGAAATIVANTGDDPAPAIYRGPGSGGQFPEESGTFKIFVTSGGAYNGTAGTIRTEWKRDGTATYATISSGIKPVGKVGAYQAWVFTASTAVSAKTSYTISPSVTALVTVDGTVLPMITITVASAATIASVISYIQAGLIGASCFFSTSLAGDNGGIIVRSLSESATSSIAISGTAFSDISLISAGPATKIPATSGTLIDLGNNIQGIFDDGDDDVCNAGDTWVYAISPVAIQVQYSAGTVVPYTATLAGGATVATKVPPYIKVINNSGYDFNGTVVAMVVS